MSASSLVTIFCDAPDCGNWEDAGIAHSAREARKQLRDTEWVLNVKAPYWDRRRQDYCCPEIEQDELEIDDACPSFPTQNHTQMEQE